MVAAVLLTAAPPSALSSLPPRHTLADLTAGRTNRSPPLAGLAVVVADRGSTLRAEAFGRAVIDPANPARERPLTPDTLVRVASISKLVVALTAWKLAEQHRIDIDVDVSPRIGFKLRNPAYPDQPITLRMLLSHTSSVADGPGYSFPPGKTLAESITPRHWAAYPPRGGFGYANLNYGIVATVLEAATGERFDRLARETILGPLGIDACYNWQGCSARGLAGAAALYRKGADEEHWDPNGPWIAQIDDVNGVAPACPVRGETACDLSRYRPGTNGTLFSPQGGLRISALGLARIGQLILNRGTVDGERLFKAATIDEMLFPVWRDEGGPHGDTYDGLMRVYASGPQLLSGESDARDQPVRGRALDWAGHLGEAYGMLGGLWVDRRHGRVYVYLITGLGDDPRRWPGRVSAFTAPEEAVLQNLTATE